MFSCFQYTARKTERQTETTETGKPVYYRMPFARTLRSLFPVVLLVVLAVATPSQTAQAIFRLGEPARVFTPPGGALRGSGWQYVGQWGGFVGTAIAPHYFVTAKHVGGWAGNKFTYRGRAYTAEARFAAPSGDLAVWRVREAMPAWASLYARPDERGRTVLLIGRGTSRGEPVYAKGALRGWRWGNGDGRQSWGLNRVEAALPASPTGAPDVADLLAFTFDSQAGPLEGQVSAGDSGGGVFLYDERDKKWKLAGVLYAVDAHYSPTPDPQNLMSAGIFDARGLYRLGPDGAMNFVSPRNPLPQPAVAYASRVSSALPFLLAVQSPTAHGVRGDLHTQRNVALLFALLCGVGAACGAGAYRVARRKSKALTAKED